MVPLLPFTPPPPAPPLPSQAGGSGSDMKVGKLVEIKEATLLSRRMNPLTRGTHRLGRNILQTTYCLSVYLRYITGKTKTRKVLILKLVIKTQRQTYTLEHACFSNHFLTKTIGNRANVLINVYTNKLFSKMLTANYKKLKYLLQSVKLEVKWKETSKICWPVSRVWICSNEQSADEWTATLKSLVDSRCIWTSEIIWCKRFS